MLTRSARLPLPLTPVRTALMEWGRATELSADRAAALVTRDPLVVCRTLMSVAAGAMTEQLDLDAFMRQGLDYTESGGGLERLTRLMLDLGVTHPMPVKRTHELMAWVRSGEFDRIVGSGEYIRREDPVDARSDGGEAVSFYAERVRDAFRDAGESVNSVGQQLAGWLRGGSDGEDDWRGRGRRRGGRGAGLAGCASSCCSPPGGPRAAPSGAPSLPRPGAGTNSSSPPISSARSRMPPIPKPPSRPSPRGPSRSASGRPLPSSVTAARSTPACVRTLITALVASAWRLTLVSASWMMR